MPVHELDLSNLQKFPDELEDPSGRLVHIVGQEIRLRQADALGVWDPNGTYTSGDLLLETWAPTALTELTGFCAFGSEDLVKGDLMRFRLSANRAAPGLYWDSASWRAPLDDTEWNSESEIDAGISSFPIQDSLTLLLRLESGDGASTPAFWDCYVFYEARYDPTEDFLRSIWQKTRDETEILATYAVNPTDPLDVIDMTDTVWEIAEPIQVFNQTSDPNLRVDLFAGRTGSLIQLSAPQVGALLVRYVGKLQAAHISSDADLELSTLPAVVIDNTAQDRTRDFLLLDYEESLRSKGVVRLRTPPARHAYRVVLRCISQSPLHDKKLADAVRRAFDTREFVRSIALDEEFVLVGLELVNQGVRVQDQQGAHGQDQMYMRMVNVTVSVWEWLPAFQDIPMVQTIFQRVRPIGVAAQSAGE